MKLPTQPDLMLYCVKDGNGKIMSHKSCIEDDHSGALPENDTLPMKLSQTIHPLFDFLKERTNLFWLMSIIHEKERQPFSGEDSRD